jgi:hypothetical protein
MRLGFWKQILILFTSFSFFDDSFSLSCQNEDGVSVDVWLGIKSPRGSMYAYYDPVIANFHLSNYSLNDTSVGALSHTLQQLWRENPESYVVYNDEVPGESYYSFTYGHTKGVFGFGSEETGFWIRRDWFLANAFGSWFPDSSRKFQ